MMEGEKMESHQEEDFEVEVFFSSYNIDFPFISRDFWSFSLSYSSFFYFSLFSICFLSLFSMLRLLGVLMIFGEKIHFFKNLFSNEMVWS
jgi:hypothetical protein